jgi:uncharacterized protein
MNYRRTLRYHWLRVMRQKEKPERIAAGSSLGVFFGLVMPPGTQMILAAAAAPFLRCNVVAAMLFTWITNPFTIPLIYPLALNLGELITGLTVRETIPTEDERFWAFITNFRMHGRAIILLLVGLMTLGGILSLPTYYSVKYAVSRYRKRLRRRVHDTH